MDVIAESHTCDGATFFLRGRHAVVTGASRGIGAAIAATLARHGADVTLMSRNEARLRQQATVLAEAGNGKAQAIALDIARPDLVPVAFARAADQFGPPHILINNAGAAMAAPIGKTDLPKWQQMLEVNLTGAFLCIREVVQAMAKGDYGRIVNIASTAGLTGYGYVTAYCAAKHGLIGLTRALAREMAHTGVTVNAVCPGYTDTEIVAEAVGNIVAKTGRTAEQALRELTAHNPQGRLVRPDEVAETVGWLCSPSSASITGQSIVVAGGELM
jgi:NAD(P)-dependent dehydrogenase (short-subunit alcohol dehydrogenase family)